MLGRWQFKSYLSCLCLSCIGSSWAICTLPALKSDQCLGNTQEVRTLLTKWAKQSHKLEDRPHHFFSGPWIPVYPVRDSAELNPSRLSAQGYPAVPAPKRIKHTLYEQKPGKDDAPLEVGVNKNFAGSQFISGFLLAFLKWDNNACQGTIPRDFQWIGKQVGNLVSDINPDNAVPQAYAAALLVEPMLDGCNVLPISKTRKGMPTLSEFVESIRTSDDRIIHQVESAVCACMEGAFEAGGFAMGQIMR